MSQAIELFYVEAQTAQEEAREVLQMGSGLLGEKRRYFLERAKRVQVHDFVLEHDSRLEGFCREYNEALVVHGNTPLAPHPWLHIH